MKLIELLKLLSPNMKIRIFLLSADEGFDYNDYVEVGETPFKLIDKTIRKITFDNYCMEIELLNEVLQANGDYAD